MATKAFTTKIKIPVSQENTTKILDCLEEQFGTISTCEIDDDELKISNIKNLMNLHKADGTVKLKAKDDGYTQTMTINSSPATAFWVQIAISVLLIFVIGIGIILLPVDIILFFVGKNKLLQSVDQTLKQLKNEF